MNQRTIEKYAYRTIVAAVLVFAAVFLLAGCVPGARLEVGAGYAGSWNNEDYPWQGDAPAFIARYSKEVYRDVNCEYLHVSNWLTGPPFNDRPESSLDFLGCSVGITFSEGTR